jgi:hypothetical protein
MKPKLFWAILLPGFIIAGRTAPHSQRKKEPVERTREVDESESE